MKRQEATILNSEDIGNIIRDARHAHGLSQRALAKKIQITPRWMNELENGKETLGFTRLFEIFAELNISLTASLPVPEATSPSKKYTEKLLTKEKTTPQHPDIK